MRVLVAPDKFAGTLTAVEAAEAIAEGWRRRAPDDEVDLVLLVLLDGAGRQQDGQRRERHDRRDSRIARAKGLGVREVTQVARLSVSASFLYEETYFILTLFYLSLTLMLSLLLQWLQRRVGTER